MIGYIRMNIMKKQNVRKERRMTDIAIKVPYLSKRYHIYDNPGDWFKQFVASVSAAVRLFFTLYSQKNVQVNSIEFA